MGRAFSPYGWLTDGSRGVAPGWDGGAPLALGAARDQLTKTGLANHSICGRAVPDMEFAVFELVAEPDASWRLLDVYGGPKAHSISAWGNAPG